MRFHVDRLQPETFAAALANTGAQSMGPEAFWARLQPRLSDFGISRVADITGLDHLGFPVAQAVRPDARSNAVTQGKAATLIGAAVGATLECLEMAAGEDLSQLPRTEGTPDQWRKLAADADWPDGGTQFVRAVELSTFTESAVPLDLISTDFALGAEAEAAPILRHSIGLGAGTTLGAALMHGLEEAIEADARIKAEATGRLTRLAVIPDDALAAQISAAGLRAALWQMPAKGGLFAVKASVMEPPGAGALPLPATGYAARHDPAQAVAAALAEAVQARLAVISGAREDITQRFYDVALPLKERQALWDVHAPSPAAALPKAQGDAPTLGALVKAVAPVFAVVLHWEPALPLAITRVVTPSLVADPLVFGDAT